MSGNTRVALGLAVVIAAAAYCVPVIALWHATGRTLPAWSSPDSYIHLNLSRLSPDQNGMVRRPIWSEPDRPRRAQAERYSETTRWFVKPVRVNGHNRPSR